MIDTSLHTKEKSYPAIVKQLANFFSVVFHPGLLICYYLLLLFIVNPYLFGVSNLHDKGLIIIYVAIISVLFPVIPVVMMYALGLSKSIQLKEKSERTIPLALTGIFYLWLYINMSHNQAIPVAFNIFVLGSVITLFSCFFINLFTKISLHTAGMGGLITGVCIMKYHFSYESFPVRIFDAIYSIDTYMAIVVSLVIAGIIGTSRLILSAHNYQDIYGGYMVGIIAQLIAMRILLY